MNIDKWSREPIQYLVSKKDGMGRLYINSDKIVRAFNSVVELKTLTLDAERQIYALLDGQASKIPSQSSQKILDEVLREEFGLTVFAPCLLISTEVDCHKYGRGKFSASHHPFVLDRFTGSNYINAAECPNVLLINLSDKEIEITYCTRQVLDIALSLRTRRTDLTSKPLSYMTPDNLDILKLSSREELEAQSHTLTLIPRKALLMPIENMLLKPIPAESEILMIRGFMHPESEVESKVKRSDIIDIEVVAV